MQPAKKNFNAAQIIFQQNEPRQIFSVSPMLKDFDVPISGHKFQDLTSIFIPSEINYSAPVVEEPTKLRYDSDVKPIKKGIDTLIITVQVEIDGIGSERKDVEIHKTRDVGDLVAEVKKWLHAKLPKSMEYEGLFLTHRGSILKESDSLSDCAIDKDAQVFVTLEFKPQLQI